MSYIEQAIRGDVRCDVDVFVPGLPKPQGSKSFKGMFRSKKTGRMVPTMAESAGDPLKHWREDVRTTLAPAGVPPVKIGSKPVLAILHFVLPRPKSTPKRKTPHATKKPDLDKLTRGVFDAMKSAGVYNDDSQVVSCFTAKRLAEPDETTGCHIRLIAFEA